MLVVKIEGLESKINTLIEENIQLKVKIAKMEERIIFNAKNRIKK
jgi:regulator of replication initiation timing